MRRFLMLSLGLALACPSFAQNNPYGIHTLIQDQMTPENIEAHLSWTHHLAGDWGYVKQMIYPISISTPGAQESWKQFVKRAYEMKIIPVLRMDELLGNKSPDTPDGTYSDIARAYARVARDLIAQNPTDKPLYLEIRNEPNNANEWSNAPNPEEYARFLIAVSKEVRAIGDKRLKVCNGALSPGGSYNNLLFIDAMCKVPGFNTCFDAWTSHPYPGNEPPSYNMHDGTAKSYLGVIDGYIEEFAHLKKGGVDTSKLWVLLTETGYNLGATGGIYPPITESNRAAYTVSAYRDYWSQWPEVLCACPYYMLSPFAQSEEHEGWVKPGSGTNPDGSPTSAHDHYWAVAALAKPFDKTGSLSGILKDVFGNPIEGVLVRAGKERSSKTNAAGFYIIGDIRPGKVAVSTEAEGYKGAKAEVTIKKAGNAIWDAELNLTGEYGFVEGSVRDEETGEPLADAIAEALPGTMTGRSGKDGVFRISGVRPGAYRLLVRRSGYDAAWVPDVRIVNGATATASVSILANRLVNGGLEPLDREPGQTAPHWGIAGNKPERWFSLDNTIKKAGLTSQRIDPSAAGENNNIWQFSGYSDVVAGATYTASAWCKTLGLEAGGRGGAQVEVQFLTNDMEMLEIKKSESLSGNNDWTRLTVVATAPPRSGRINVILRAGGTAGSAWFDDALMRGPRPQRD